MVNRERITITLRNDILRQVDSMIDGRDIRNRSHSIETILDEKFGDLSIRKAIILGGGRGVEIDGYSDRTSPLLLKYKGKRLVEYHIEKLKEIGVSEIIFAIGMFGEDVRDIVGNGDKYGLKVMYFERDYGTASVLRQARSLLKDTFLMINGHVITTDIDINDMFIMHKNNKCLITIALTTVSKPGGFGQVVLKGNRVIDYIEKPEQNKTISHIINAGVYIIDPEVCDMVKIGEESLEKNIFPRLARDGKLSGYLIDTKWKCIKNNNL